MSIRHILLVFGIALPVFLVWSLPASLAPHLIPAWAPPIAFDAPAGTLLHGRADDVRSNGLSLRGVTWDVVLGALLTGRAEALVTVRDAYAFNGWGTLTAPLSGTGPVRVSALRAKGSLAELRERLGERSALSVDGDVSVVVDEMIVPEMWPSALTGHLSLRRLGLGGAVLTELGEIGGPIILDGEDLVIDLREKESDLEVRLRAVVTKSGAWSLKGTVRPKNVNARRIMIILKVLGVAKTGEIMHVNWLGRW